jgi:hypothetical protein
MRDSVGDTISNCETIQTPAAKTVLSAVADTGSAEFRRMERTLARLGRLTAAR